jgi:Sigma-70, region 4/Bacterial RNA polymerase, alpha chain C terminal domain
MFDQLLLKCSKEHQKVKTGSVKTPIFDPSLVPCYWWGPHARLGAMPHQMLEDSDLIFIPQEARGQPIAKFPISVRLAHVLQSKGIQLIGELHGLTFSGLAARRNCGQKTLQELSALVRTMQVGHQPPKTTPAPTASTVRAQAGCFFVPTDGERLNPFELPMSRRLEHVLRSKGIARLGDLQRVPFSELLKVEGCGRKAIEELVRLLERAAAGEFQPSSEPFSPSETGELLRSVDTIVAKLPPRNQEILLLRFGATDNRAITLEEVGSTFKLTRERVRQIVERALPAMRKEGGPRLTAQLTGVAAICRKMVCPLTPALLSQWLGQDSSRHRFSFGFYVRLMTELNPEISGWPKGQEPSAAQHRRANTILTALQWVLEDGGPTLPFKRAFEITSGSARFRRLSVDEFLEAIKHSKLVVVQFPQPDQPHVRLRHLRLTAVAKSILEPSDKPLTPEEILSRAQSKFGSDLVDWDPRTLGNALIPEKGFYLLGPRAYGLRQHFRLPQTKCRNARADVQKLLAKENRPISTTEIVNDCKFPWTEQLNGYELAQILREDKQFIDLGRFLFALAEWGIEEREYVKDLIPKVLAEVGRPLSASQILARLQRLRSTSPSLISAMLRKHPLVRYFGFGHYGLHSWGDSVKATIVSDAALIERIIRRSEPPLTFSYLCEVLNVPNNDELAAKLWQTCVSLRSIIRSPDECTPTTLLLHKSCSLERALVATARALNRPLPLYEFQWELNGRFGPLFAQRSNAEIRRCLEQSRLFLRDSDGEFILDIHLDQLGLDEEAIRQACLEILSDSNEIVGCDDLIERLEAEGKVWEELSPDILGSLLREDEAFQEVGRNRFRAKPCKR